MKMSDATMVVGTEVPSVTVGRQVEPQPGVVWHAVDASSRRTLCGAGVAAVFPDLPWRMGATSMLCQGCVLVAARS